MSTSLDLDGAIRLKLPISEADVRKLKAGDFVLLDGNIVITAGLPTHQRIQDYVDAGKGDTYTSGAFTITPDHSFHLFRSALTYRFSGNPLWSKY